MEHIETIAELGLNMNGSMETAYEMVKMAAFCGVDAVKSQKRTVKEYLTEEQYNRPYDNPSSFGKTYGEHREVLELDKYQHNRLMGYAKELNLVYFTSVWDITAAQEMNEIGIPIFKIASASLTYDALLEEIKSFDRPIYMSTGMSTLEEVDHAVDILKGSDLTIFHCTSCYPCTFDDLRLGIIPFLLERYNLPVGLSGHHRGIAVDIAAITLGATKLERHFTLDRTMKGTDHAASLEPGGLHKVVRDIRATERSMLVSKKELLECEIPSWEKLRTVK